MSDDIEVTQEMIEAADCAYEEWEATPKQGREVIYAAIYRAMHAARPKEWAVAAPSEIVAYTVDP